MPKNYDEIGRVRFSHEEMDILEGHWEKLSELKTVSEAKNYLKDILDRDFSENELLVIGLIIEQKKGAIRSLSVIPGGWKEDD